MEDTIEFQEVKKIPTHPIIEKLDKIIKSEKVKKSMNDDYKKDLQNILVERYKKIKQNNMNILIDTNILKIGRAHV